MSFILMAKAVNESIPDALCKWLLVVLADHANEETHTCFPSLDRGSSKRSTIYTIFPTVAHSNAPVAESNPNLSIKPINNIEGYIPNKELIDQINKKGELDHDHETNQFVDFHIAKGTKFKDINRAYRFWCNNRIKWNTERSSSSTTTKGWSAHNNRRKSSIFGGIYNKIQSERE